ncbi:hypothetical protein AVEN_208477-1, partial [Araneus ventricosus]
MDVAEFHIDDMGEGTVISCKFRLRFQAVCITTQTWSSPACILCVGQA